MTTKSCSTSVPRGLIQPVFVRTRREHSGGNIKAGSRQREDASTTVTGGLEASSERQWMCSVDSRILSCIDIQA